MKMKVKQDKQNGEANKTGKIATDKVCESQVLDCFCLERVNTMSKTRRAKYAFLKQIRGRYTL